MNNSLGISADGGSILFRRLGHAQLQRIHQASLEILQRTGVRVRDAEAMALLKKGGCSIAEGNLVKYPPHLVEWAIRVAPKQFVMCDRDGRKAMTVGGYNSYYGTGSDCPFVLDHRTGERRQARLSDVEEGIRVCDHLENVDFVLSMFIPFDVPVPISDRYQMEAMLLNTKKPILFVTHDLEGAKDAVEMAEVAAGGADALCENPQICCFVNIDAPLRHNAEAVQKMMYMAAKGLPCTCSAPLSTRTVTTPLTMAGNLALNNAGQLAGLVLSQIVREGAPQVPMRTGGGGMDMRTMVALHSSPDVAGYRGGLAHFYDLPSFGWAASCDSKVPDEQAAAEAAFTLLVDALEGANLIHDVGFVESGKTNSLEMLVMSDEMIGWVKRFMKPQVVDDETLGLDVIHEIGPDGNYLETEHTFRHFREEWSPQLMDRGIFENWQSRGGKSFRERARDQVEKMLQTHAAPDLGKDVAQGIRAVLERAADREGVAV